jgi:hypothetical protein
MKDPRDDPNHLRFNTNQAGTWPKTNWTTGAQDGPIRGLFPHDGWLWVATDHSLNWFIGDGVPTGSSVPEAGMGRVVGEDDLVWIQSHNGRLYTWIGKEVHFYDTTDDTWTPTNLRGRETFGVASVGRWLVVSLQSNATGQTELWGWDGRGWWLLDSEADAGFTIKYPANISGVGANADLLVGRGATLN